MEAINEVNELLTTKLCSPVIVYGVVLVVSLITIYCCRKTLNRYNTQKMENLHNLFTMQEVKFLITLGVVMFGLCQYNKTELAWIFLIFPVIYSLIQNSLLYIHVSSAMQNAPQESRPMQGQHYGLQAPLLAQEQTGQAPPKPEITKPKQPTGPPTITSGDFTLGGVPSNGFSGSSLGGGSSFGGF